MRIPILFALITVLTGSMACQREKAAAPAPAAAVASTPGTVAHVSAATFEPLMAQDKPVLVDFWAPWCGPCRAQGPILEDVAGRIGTEALVAKVNVDEEKDLASRYGVRAIPTLVILRRGKEVQRFVGVQQAEELVNALRAAK